MKKAFQETYGKVQAPQSLKAETLALMKEEQQKGSAKGRRTGAKRILPWGAAAVLCGVLACLFLLPGRGAVYITPMEEGVHYDRVELSDGVLYFQSGRVSISVTPNAGSAMSSEESREGDDFAEEKTSPGGGTLICTRSSQGLPEADEADWSQIDGQQVYVTVLKKEPILYQAVFEKEGTVWEITGEGVPQKEFIDYLYEKMTE